MKHMQFPESLISPSRKIARSEAIIRSIGNDQAEQRAVCMGLRAKGVVGCRFDRVYRCRV